MLRALSTLDCLSLIDRLPSDRVRLKFTTGIRWRPGGPLAQTYEERARAEFLKDGFTESGDVCRFSTGELSALSARLLARRLERLTRDFYELSEVDAALPKSETTSIAMLTALRPWTFSLFEGLKRRR